MQIGNSAIQQECISLFPIPIQSIHAYLTFNQTFVVCLPEMQSYLKGSVQTTSLYVCYLCCVYQVNRQHK